jgi:hypothetical protein
MRKHNQSLLSFEVLVFRIFFLISIVLTSCSNDSELPYQSCQEGFNYTMGGETITLTPVTGAVMVEFLDSENLETQIQSLFATYEFLDEEFFPSGNSNQRIFRLKSQNCDALYESLMILNQDESIAAATPRLKPHGPGIHDPSPWTLVNRVSIHPNKEEDIPEILEWALENGLEWEYSTWLTQRFVVKNVITGFEPLEIATKAKKELNAKWADADFIIPIRRH